MQVSSIVSFPRMLFVWDVSKGWCGLWDLSSNSNLFKKSSHSTTILKCFDTTYIDYQYTIFHHETNYRFDFQRGGVHFI